MLCGLYGEIAVSNSNSSMSFDLDDISDWFWNIIRGAAKDRFALERIIERLSSEQIYRFALEFLEASSRLQEKPFTYFVTPGSSEDDVEEISWWVVSQGKEFYSNVWRHPENMPSAELVEDNSSQILYSVAEGILDDKLGEEGPDVREDYAKFLTSPYSRVDAYLKAQQEHDR